MKAKLKKPLTALMMAWGTYLAIPCPYKVWDDALRPWQIVCLPPVGLIVGGLWALCAALFAHFRFTGFLAAAILTALLLRIADSTPGSSSIGAMLATGLLGANRMTFAFSIASKTPGAATGLRGHLRQTASSTGRHLSRTRYS